MRLNAKSMIDAEDRLRPTQCRSMPRSERNAMTLIISPTSDADYSHDLTTPRHGFATRIVHTGLADAIVVQLGTSLILNPDGSGNTAFVVHQYSGLLAFCFVASFWALAAFRRRGTPLVQLFPWFSSRRLAAVWNDTKTQLTSLFCLRLPMHSDETPLTSAIHGLGLALMAVMALSGTVYYFVNSGNPDASGLVGLTMGVHKLFANLVWAYLIGHAGMALIAHYGRRLSLREMWSLRSRG